MSCVLCIGRRKQGAEARRRNAPSIMSEQAPKQSIPTDWDPVYGWKPLAAGMDSGVIDFGREHPLAWYTWWGFELMGERPLGELNEQ